ncbi:MAG: hypothetical protein ACXIUZ_01615 [Lysobacteraceae bacterium]
MGKGKEFRFKAVTQQAFEQTCTEWLRQWEGGENLGSWESWQVWLDFFARDIQGTEQASKSGSIVRADGGGGIYGVFSKTDGDVAHALLSLGRTNGRTRALKMMDITVAPRHDLACVPEDRPTSPTLVALGWIAATAIVGALELSYGELPAEKIKIGHGVPLTNAFLTSIATALEGASEGRLQVAQEGHYVAVTKVSG